ncbi:hypothetical protein MTO96_005325 [Rhipicephalus appendiculatus]
MGRPFPFGGEAAEAPPPPRGKLSLSLPSRVVVLFLVALAAGRPTADRGRCEAARINAKCPPLLSTSVDNSSSAASGPAQGPEQPRHESLQGKRGDMTGRVRLWRRAPSRRREWITPRLRSIQEVRVSFAGADGRHVCRPSDGRRHRWRRRWRRLRRRGVASEVASEEPAS